MAEILGWATALLSLIGFGLSLGLNPALYGATADMLARKTSVPVHLGSMILGLYIGASALFLLLQAFNRTSFVSAVKQRAHDELFNRAVDLGAGLVFLVLAIVIAVWALRGPERAPKPTKDTNTDNAQGSHPWTYLLIGLSSSVIGFTTLPIMYLVGRVTTSVTPHLLLRLLAFAVFLVALAAPFIAMAWVWRRFPNRANQVSELYARALARDYRWAGAGILAVCACIFFALGFFLPR